MANGLTFTIDTKALERRLSRYQSSLEEKLRSEWPAIWQEAIDAIALRAPNQAEELAFVLGGANLPTETQVDVDRGGWGGTQRSSYPFSGTRYHFIREPGTWIASALKLPDAHTIDNEALTMGFGRLSVLEGLTHFTWIDFSRRIGEVVHVSEYGLYSFFEYGKVSGIHPRGFGDTAYKLRPGDFATWFFSKTYPRMGMVTGFDAQAFLSTAIASRIRAVKY